jgi:cell shape-determining protein MreD
MKRIILIITILIVSVILDVALSYETGIYFTIISLSFILTKLNPKYGIISSLITGLLMDIIYSTYIGPMILIFFTAALIAFLVREYYKVVDVILFYFLIFSMLTLIFARVHFAGFTKTIASTILIGFPIYFILNELLNKTEQEKIA